MHNVLLKKKKTPKYWIDLLNENGNKTVPM